MANFQAHFKNNFKNWKYWSSPISQFLSFKMIYHDMKLAASKNQTQFPKINLYYIIFHFCPVELYFWFRIIFWHLFFHFYPFCQSDEDYYGGPELSEVENIMFDQMTDSFILDSLHPEPQRLDSIAEESENSEISLRSSNSNELGNGKHFFPPGKDLNELQRNSIDAVFYRRSTLLYQIWPPK